MNLPDAVKKLADARLRRENARIALSSPQLYGEKRLRVTEELAKAATDFEQAVLDVIASDPVIITPYVPKGDAP